MCKKLISHSTIVFLFIRMLSLDNLWAQDQITRPAFVDNITGASTTYQMLMNTTFDRIYTVNPGASNATCNNTSANLTFDNIGDALACAIESIEDDKNVKIIIQAGTYREGDFTYTRDETLTGNGKLFIEGQGNVIIKGSKVYINWVKIMKNNKTFYSHDYTDQIRLYAGPHGQENPDQVISHRREMLFVNDQPYHQVMLEQYNKDFSKPGYRGYTYNGFTPPENALAPGTFGVVDCDSEPNLNCTENGIVPCKSCEDENNGVPNDSRDKVYFYPYPGLSVTNTTINATIEVTTYSHWIKLKDFDHVYIHNLTVKHFATVQPDKDNPGAIAIMGSDGGKKVEDILIEDVTCLWNNGAGLGLFEVKDVTVNNVVCDYNGFVGINPRFLMNAIFNTPTTSYNNWRGAMSSNFRTWATAGIKLTNSEKVKISNHKSIANEAVGLWVDVNNKEIGIEGCVGMFNKSHGLFLEFSDGPIWVNKSLYAHSSRASFRLETVKKCEVSRSIFYGSGEAFGAIQIGYGERNKPIEDFGLENSIISSSLNHKDYLVVQGVSTGDNAVKYNSFLNSQNNTYTYLENGNVFWGTQPSQSFVTELTKVQNEAEPTLGDFDTWRGTVGHNTSVWANPEFTDPENGDFSFKLQDQANPDAPYNPFDKPEYNFFLPQRSTLPNVTLSATELQEAKEFALFASRKNFLPLSASGNLGYGKMNFVLVDADSDQKLLTLEDGAIVSLQQFTPSSYQYSIDAIPEIQDGVESAFIQITKSGSCASGECTGKVESVKPFTAFGDLGNMNNPDYTGMPLTTGNYTVSTIPYNDNGAQGDIGAANAVSFEVFDYAIGPVPQLGTITFLATEENSQPSLNSPNTPTLTSPATDVYHISNSSQTKIGITVLPASGVIDDKKEAIKFQLEGPITVERIEGAGPYSLFGDNFSGGNSTIYGRTFPPGIYTLTLTPMFRSDNLVLVGDKRGYIEGTPKIIEIHIVDEAILTSFALVDAGTDKDIKVLNSGDVIDLNVHSSVTIRANTNPFPLKTGQKVGFFMQVSGTSKTNPDKVESVAPYALAGDDPTGNYNPYGFTAGNFTLKAVIYDDDGDGIEGSPNRYGTLIGAPLEIDIQVTGGSSISNSPAFGAQDVLYPNPAKGTFHLSVNSTYSTTGKLVVYNFQGEVVYEQDANLQGGIETLTFTLPEELPTDTYIYQFTFADTLKIGRLELKK